MRRTLHLGMARHMLYPLNEEDYQILKELKAPVVKFDKGYTPILIGLCERNKINIKYHRFLDLEAEVIRKIKREWPDYFEGDAGDMTFTWSVPNEDDFVSKADSLSKKLKQWYLKHFVNTETETRFSKNRYKTTFRKLKT